ncbi:hypothetical protein Hdeb2414_s0027g00688911 [Helianthus debilis subsp. tardiflorus]
MCSLDCNENTDCLCGQKTKADIWIKVHTSHGYEWKFSEIIIELETNSREHRSVVQPDSEAYPVKSSVKESENESTDENR